MRWIIGAGLGLAVLIVLGFGLLAMVPAERVAALVAAEFETSTGQKLTLTGEVRPRLWPGLGVTTGPVSIANADWAESDAPLFAAEALSVGISFSALLGGEVRITGLTVDSPAITLERSAEGQENWVFATATDASAKTVPPSVTGLTLDRATITGGSLRFIDRKGGRVIRLDGLDAALSVPDASGPFTLVATGLAGGHDVTLDLTGEVFSAFLAGRVVPLTVALAAGGSTLGFDGRAGIDPLIAEGSLKADLSDLPALSAAIGMALTAPASGLGQDRLTLAGQMTMDGTGAIFLRGADIVADGNALKGDFDFRPGTERPKLLGQVTAGPITIGTRASGEAGGENGGGVNGWPDAEIDVSALGAMDMELSLATPSMDLGALRLGKTRVLITVDRARAVVALQQVAGYGGQIGGDFVVNGRGGLSVGGRLQLTGLETEPLFSDLAGWDRLASQGDLELEFLGVGNSVAAIMASLEGKGSLELGKGELSGFDIAAMLQTLDPAYVGDGQKTVFDGLAGTFIIAGGVVSNSDLKFVAPSLTASGAGDVDLGGRKLDYGIRPTALAAADGSGGVMVPLLITGPWSDPGFRLDLEGIAREKMEAEVKAATAEAEARLRAELEARLEEELGISLTPDRVADPATVPATGATDPGTALDSPPTTPEQAVEEGARKALEAILGNN